MKNILTFIFAVCSLIAAAQYSSEYFRIGDVRDSWYTQPASYDTVVFEVKPKGLVTEIGVYFNISTRGTNYSPDDSLEIQLSFSLPEKAEVTDMWLWVKDTIVKADVFDKWYASQTYDGIVKRRKDPSILYKYNYYNYYSQPPLERYMLRVFPLMTNLPRKVKFTYIVPTEALNTLHPYVNLPVNLLNLSNSSIPKFKIRVFPDNNITNPSIPEYPSIVFHQVGNCLESDITGINNKSDLSLSFDNQYKDKQFTGTYTKAGGESYYEMNLVPNKLFNLKNSKKGLFLFDFIESNCSSIDIKSMLSGVKEKLLNGFTPTDSFNIMISGMLTNTLSDKWLPADSLTIVNTFNKISINDFNTYSSLPTLLIDGINFIKDHNQGTIILIASSNSNGTYEEANDLMIDYLGMMGNDKIPIQILNLDNIDTYEEEQNIGGRTYFGNEYLFINLSMLTIGDYYSLKETSFSSMLSSTFQKLSGYFTSMDLYVSLENGFTYANYDLSENAGLIYIDQPIQKSGKFSGTGRMNVIISAQSQTGEFYHKEFSVDQNDIIPMDSITRTIWAAHTLKVMKTYEQNNTTIEQIIKMSKLERVLTDYTAFLALEPTQGPIPGDENNPHPFNVENLKTKDLTSLAIYPNPATNNSVISFNLQKKAKVRIMIYDILGKLIKVIDEGNINSGAYTVKLDASTLQTGIYICKLEIDNTINDNLKFTVIH